jgi:hypothetical protein
MQPVDAHGLIVEPMHHHHALVRDRLLSRQEVPARLSFAFEDHSLEVGVVLEEPRSSPDVSWRR